jgi:uncharacterized protein with GYD domain
MATYVILTRFSERSFDDPKDFRKLADRVTDEIKKQCPNVRWKESYVTFGTYDVVDVVEADDAAAVARAAMIIRGHAHATTETLAAIPWKTFLDTLA